MASPVPMRERDYEAEEDARSLARAMVIKADPERLKKAKSAAKRILKEKRDDVKEQKEECDALRKISGGKYKNMAEARDAAKEDYKNG